MADSLDELIKKNGEVFDESKKTVMTGVDAVNTFNSLAYDDAVIMPNGQSETPTADEVAPTKDDALNTIQMQNALEKLRQENAHFLKMSDDEKLMDYMFHTECINFFRKYGYELSGSQKRSVKRDIEKRYKSGKIKLTQQQKDDILFELNKASADHLDAVTKQMSAPTSKTTINNEVGVESINSLIRH